MIRARVDEVRERIERAAGRAGRDPREVTLVAVSKTKPPEAVREAFAAGVRAFGENKVQEAEAKARALEDLAPAGLRWHLVGHLQSNKAKKAAVLFERIHSVDGEGIARRLAALGGAAGAPLRGLLQVNISEEATKHGVDEADLEPLLERLAGLDGLRLDGLMTLPAYRENPEDVRPCFARLRELRDAALARGLLSGSELSMGMSHDFEVAIEEGATLVRVGTALFGPRTGKG